MELSASPSVGRELRVLQAELGALQAGQAAELGQLERALARARAAGGRQAAEAARLRQEVAELRAELRRGRELCGRDRPEVTAPRGDAGAREQRRRGATAEVARLREELARLRAQQEALGEEHRALRHCHHRLCRHLRATPCHRCPEGPGDTEGPPPVSPHPEDPEDAEDAQPRCAEGTQSQETTGGLKPFVLFLVASAIIFLYPRLRRS